MRIAAPASLVCLASLVASALIVGCGGADASVSESGVYGVDGVVAQGDNGEDGLSDADKDATDPGEGENGEDQNAIGDIFSDGSEVETIANLNLRSGPSTGKAVLRTIPNGAEVSVVDGTAQNGFIKISHSGLTGYAAYRYLQASSSSSSSGSGSTSPGNVSSGRQGALDIAASGVGMSYWWGHGRFTGGSVTSSNRGSCNGSCPSCSHKGSYGADCSGFVAKAWAVPSSNTSLTSDNHPYSTSDFYGTTGGGKWGPVSKSSMKAGDALVYRSGGSGHIFLFEKGDAWGQPWALEARGCSYGVVHNLRTAGTQFKGIKRVGY